MTATRICFVGDSITAGTYDEDFLGWPGRICRGERAKGHDISMYNLGIRAETSSDIRARWRAECEPRLPADYDGRLVLSFGVNDMAELADGSIRVDKAQSLENARAMVTEARDWKPTLWVGPIPTPDQRQPFHPTPTVFYSFSSERCADLNAAYKALAAELGVPYLDMFSALNADTRWGDIQQLQGDGVHPPAAGYAVMAEAVSAWAAWRAWFDA